MVTGREGEGGSIPCRGAERGKDLLVRRPKYFKN